MGKDEGEIEYPYMPNSGRILYVGEDNKFIKLAKQHAKKASLDKSMPNASVLVKDDKVIGMGANGSDFHLNNTCRRVQLKIPTGQGYELCPGCHPINHSEPKAVASALKAGNVTTGANLYLWGHWWCCQPCWDVLLANKINTVFLLEGSNIIFNKSRK